MQINSRFAGAPLRTHTVTITQRHATNFAASIGDANPCYLDDEREGGLVAHPMIVSALTWPASLNIGEYLLAEDFPAHLNKMQVHFSETILWHAPMTPGMTLTLTGTLAAILPHPGGTHMVLRYDAHDEKQRLIFTEYTGAILRNVKCVPEGKGRETLPTVPSAKSAAEPLWQSPIPIDPLAAYLYDAGADISFPIHTSPAFAHSVGLPGTILHGTATLGIAVRELLNREAGCDPNRLQQLSCRFTDMVIPGTTITVSLGERLETDSHIDLFFSVLTERGKRAISGGHARIAK